MFRASRPRAPKQSVARCETLSWAVSPGAKQGCGTVYEETLLGLSAQRHQITLSTLLKAEALLGILAALTFVPGQRVARQELLNSLEQSSKDYSNSLGHAQKLFMSQVQHKPDMLNSQRSESLVTKKPITVIVLATSVEICNYSVEEVGPL